MFAALELCENEVDDYRLFKAIIRVAKNAGVTPYALDKLFWLIGRETFMTILRLGLLGAAKKTLSNSPCKKGAVDDSGTDAVQSIKIDSIGADNPAPIFLAQISLSCCFGHALHTVPVVDGVALDIAVGC